MSAGFGILKTKSNANFVLAEDCREYIMLSHRNHRKHGNVFSEHECRRYRELLASGHANGAGW